MADFREIFEMAGLAIDAIGVAVIVLGLAAASVRFALALRTLPDPYRRLRQDLGRAILLGLEFLVAADIIRTVAVSPTIENGLALGLIVLIRTFLSMAMQMELEGEWPWNRARSGRDANARS
jgi:uncharacterized membrane protein